MAPGPETPERLAAHHIGAVRAAMQRFLESELRRVGHEKLVVSQGSILFALYTSPEPPTMAEVAERIRRDRSTVTYLVGGLVRMGYARKERSKTDARQWRVVLTEKGRRFEPAFREISRRLQERLYGGLTPEEGKELDRLLGKVRARFEAANATGGARARDAAPPRKGDPE